MSDRPSFVNWLYDISALLVFFGERHAKQALACVGFWAGIGLGLVLVACGLAGVIYAGAGWIRGLFGAL